MRARIPLAGCLLALAACETGPSAIADPPIIPKVDAEVGAPFTLTITPRLESLPPLGRPLTLIAEHVDTGETVTEILPAVRAWPQVVPLESLRRGRWSLRVFVDRDEDQVFDDCPYPPAPTDTEQLDLVDSFSGQTEVTRVIPGGAATITVEQRICGPGTRETRVRGEIAVAEGAVVAGPIGLILEPQADAERIGEPPPPVRLNLHRGELTGTLAFDIGELVPGRYAIVAFADADGDASPSPCSQGIGGGDRFVSAARSVTIGANQRVDLGEPLLLAAADCPDALTGLVGTVSLAPDLPADPDFDGPLGPLSGQVHLAWFPSASAESVAEAPILTRVDARPLPHGFTVTGVPPGLWRMVAWIDRDRDGSFTPCGGLTGIDATWTQVEDVQVVAGEITAIEPIVLTRHPCDANAETGLTGTLDVDVEPGAVGSGRPVRAELIPLSEQAPRSLQLIDNHTDLPPDGRFIAAGLPAGRYDVIVYVDTDRDGRLVSCRQALFADRAIARRDAVTIEAGRITALGEVAVQAEGCETPRAEIRPQFNFSERIPEDLVADLRLIVEERGGWGIERRLRTRVSPTLGTLFTETIDLAPGDFRLTAWLDTNGNGQFDDCSAADEDSVVARLDLTLDEGAAVRRPIFEMDLACGR